MTGQAQTSPADAIIERFGEVVKMGVGNIQNDSPVSKAEKVANQMRAAARAMDMECVPGNGHFYLKNKSVRVRIWSGSLRHLFPKFMPFNEHQVAERLYYLIELDRLKKG